MNQIKELVDYYFEKKIKGMDFSEIRKELKAKNIDEGEIKAIIREIDERALEHAKSAGKMNPRDLRLIGYALMLIGGVLTAGIYFKWMDLSGYHFIAYGPVIIGYVLVVMARRQQRK